MAKEDYTTYVEVDTGNDRIQFTGTDHLNYRVTRNESTYLYDDKGAGHFGDFEHLVDVESDFEDSQALATYWMLSNHIGDYKAIRDANEECINGNFYSIGVDKWIRLSNFDGAAVTNDEYVALANTRYYLKIKRDDTTGTIKIYSDSARTNLLDTLTLTVENDTFRYVYACASYNTGTDDRDSDNIIENLNLQEGGETHDPTDDANASDSVTFNAGKNLADDANASDANTFNAGTSLADTAKASDGISFQMFHAHNIEDTAKASDSLTFDAEINLADIAKASDLFSSDVPPPIEYPCPTFTLHGTSTNILFPKPSWANPNNEISKNVNLFNFWEGDIDTVDVGINTQTLSIGGTVFIYDGVENWGDLAAMTVWLNSIKNAMNSGEEFTINELGDCLNGVYVVKNFVFDTIKGVPYAFNWGLNLERVRDI